MECSIVEWEGGRGSVVGEGRRERKKASCVRVAQTEGKVEGEGE